MPRLTIHSQAPTDGVNETPMAAFMRRIEATPPGQCPLTLQYSLLSACAAQTCGKCVPCRDGLPQLAKLLKKIVDCEGTQQDLESMRALAEMIRETSDCAIGWDAAQAVLDGLTLFADEYKSHIEKGRCAPKIHQSVPCETFCPAHVDVPGYIALTAAERYADAVALIRKDNPFPTACAFVCEHPCEHRCRRTLIDAPINIRGIKRFAVDNAAADTVPSPKALPATGRRIAVIGAGPSGMTCAYFLGLMGHTVEIFEEKELAGGMMRYGIPAYRFPRERLDEDIRAILAAGDIELHTKVEIDEESFKDLTEKFDAVYVAIGAQAGKKLEIPGIHSKGVMSAVELLRDIGEGNHHDFTGKKVAVIGGGNVAMDCARTAVRLGAEEVNLIYRRRIEDMTALKEEIDSAQAEGVEMVTLAAPTAIETDDQNNCKAVHIEPQMISAFSRGRAAPVKADKPAYSIEADIVLVAVGQDIISAPFEAAGMKAKRGIFVTDEYLAADGIPHVYAGGDCQTGPTTVIKAVAAGKVAARNIDEMLGFHHTLDCGIHIPEPHANNRTPTGRITMMERPVKFRKRDFEGVEVGMSHEEMRQECGRCLRCDHFGAGAMNGGRVQYV